MHEAQCVCVCVCTILGFSTTNPEPHEFQPVSHIFKERQNFFVCRLELTCNYSVYSYLDVV